MSDDPFVKIRIEVCRPAARLPEYTHPGDAGMDLRAAEETIIAPGQTVAVPTGIKLAIPAGYEIQVRPRSGLSLHTPLRIPNSPGTIDAGFRDEVRVIMSNESRVSGKPDGQEALTLDARGNLPGSYRIRVGDRIAQMVLARVETVQWETVGSVSAEGQDRGGGFGHTGVQ